MKSLVYIAVGISSSCLSPQSRNPSLSTLDSSAVPQELRLPEIISNGMVVQEEKPLTLWGQARPDASVEVTLRSSSTTQKGGGTQRTKADSRGAWRVTFPPLKASLTPWEINVESLGKKTIVRDVLVGEVWLSGGQSNMELRVQNVLDGATLIRETQESLIRIFNQDHVGVAFAARPSQTPVFFSEGGSWSRGNDEKGVAQSSAVALVFAKTLLKHWREQGKTKPIAIINTAVGNTPVASWLSRETLLENPELKKLLPSTWHTKPSSAVPQPYLQPTAAYNHKIAPLRHIALRGVILSHGEANMGPEPKAQLYQKSLVALINSWRQLWNDQKIYFLFTTLPAAASLCPSPEHLDAAAYTREAQQNTATKIARAIAIPTHDLEPTWDFGTWPYVHPIHPLNKTPVGKRLAEAALGFVYREKDAATQLPPRITDVRFDGETAFVTFADVGLGLKTFPQGAPIKGFALASANKVFYPAQARQIDPQRVEVRSSEVSSPEAITYGFTQMNQGANLFGSQMPVWTYRSPKASGKFVRIKPFFPYEMELQTHELGTHTRTTVEKNPRATRGLYRLVVAETKEGSISFRFRVPHDGVYDLSALHLIPPQNTTVKVRIDDQSVDLPSTEPEGSQEWKETLLVSSISLKAGFHDIRFVLNHDDASTTHALLQIDQLRLYPQCPKDPSLRNDWF